MFDDLFSMEGKYARVMNWLWDVIVLSLLWLLCCLPIVTIGASSTAAYYAASKVMRHKTGKVIPEFFSSFRTNLRQGIFLTVILGILYVFVLLECLYVFSDPTMPGALLCALCFFAAAMTAFFSYLWAWLSRFCMGSAAFVKTAVIVTFRHIGPTILLLLIQVLVAVGIFFMPWGILIFPGVGIFASTYPMEKVLKSYTPAVSEDDPEVQKWYYQ